MTPQLEAVERAIIDVERYGEEHAEAANLEMTLEHSRAGVKEEIIKRLVNPPIPTHATVEELADRYSDVPAKGLSPTAAEKAAHVDPLYIAHLDALRAATLVKNLAYTRLISARLRALLGLVHLSSALPGPVGSMMPTEIDLDLIRARDESKDQLVGGVPR